MKIQYYETYLRPFVQLAEEDGDGICAVLFSREENAFKGTFKGMTEQDALMLIGELAKTFRLSPINIVEQLKEMTWDDGLDLIESIAERFGITPDDCRIEKLE